MLEGTMRRKTFLAAALAAILILGLAGLAAQGGPQETGNAPPSEPAPQPLAPPQAAETQPPEPPQGTEPAPPPAAPPRIIRVVCTDHLCGGCDGKCHKESGHVAVDKKGHCACTPTEGSPLDLATRQAHARTPPR